MMPSLPIAATTALLTSLLAASADARTLIHAGRLVDGRSNTARTSVTVTVDGDRIVSVADGYAGPARATWSSIWSPAR